MEMESVPGSSAGARPQYKRARTPRRRGRVQRRVLDRKVFTFTRKFKQDIVVQNATSVVNSAMQWKLVDLPNYTEFSALFDMYRINYVDVMFIYDHNSGEVATAAGTAANANMGLPNIYLARDYDDADALSTIDDYLQYEGVVIKRLGNTFTMRVYPHIAVAAYGSGAFSSYKNEKKAWIDCSSQGVAHYGLKMGIDASMCNPMVSAATWIGRLTLVHSFNVSFKNVR